MKNLLTIVIPSHNRPKRLERLLNFYIENGFENIVVADSSIKEFENVIKYNGYISYRHLPNVNLAKKIIEIKEYVNTPYVVLCAEDDYLMPGALENIVRFLELNKDYKSAQGYWLQYRPYENDNLRSLYPQVSIKNSLHQNDPKQRTISLFEHYFQFYYVVMTKELFFDSYESIIEKDKIILDNLCLLEMWQATYCSYNGKHAVLPLFYGIREFIHGSAGHRFLSYYELKKNNKDLEQVKYFEEKMESIIGKDVFLDLLRAYSDFLLWWSDIISTPITKRFINKLDEHFFNNKIKQHIAIRKLKSIIEDKKIMQRDMQLTLSNLNKYHEYVYGRL